MEVRFTVKKTSTSLMEVRFTVKRSARRLLEVRVTVKSTSLSYIAGPVGTQLHFPDTYEGPFHRETELNEGQGGACHASFSLKAGR